MRVSISIPGLVAGAVLGTAIRYGLTFSQVYPSGWFWWYEHGLHASPGTAGFAGFVDINIFTSNNHDAGYCRVVSLLPGLIGGVIGAASGAFGRPLVGATVGGLASGLVLLLMRLPELYRPGWFGSLWLDYNVPILVEGLAVGAIMGALAGGIGWLSRRLRGRQRWEEPSRVQHQTRPARANRSGS